MPTARQGWRHVAERGRGRRLPFPFAKGERAAGRAFRTWQLPHAHLGALEAICGRAPYYQHLIPKLRDAIGNPPKSLRELNLSIHDDIATFLGVVATLTPEARERGNEIAADINPELSIIDPLMRFGKETLLALLCRAGKM